METRERHFIRSYVSCLGRVRVLFSGKIQISLLLLVVKRVLIMTVCSLLLCWFSLARASASRALALPQAAHSPAGASPFPRTAHLLPPGPGRGRSAGADPSWGSSQRSCKLPGKVPGPSGALQAQCLSSLYSYSQVLPL